MTLSHGPASSTLAIGRPLASAFLEPQSYRPNSSSEDSPISRRPTSAVTPKHSGRQDARNHRNLVRIGRLPV